MSLLWMEHEQEFQNLVEKANICEQEAKPEYFAALPTRVKRIIYRDTRYNIDFLYTAYVLKEQKIMADYSRWLYQLMAAVLQNKSRQETAEYVEEHFEAICKAVRQEISPEKQPELLQLLDLAKRCVRSQAGEEQEEADGRIGGSVRKPSVYEREIHQYMECLLEKNPRKAMDMVRTYLERGIPVTAVYVEILAESMRRVGELWHHAKITVDTEHYCTSVTQMAMAQIYPMLFTEERKEKSILCACPGTELHEIGARMVADLFENDGWDSVFLGAAVPADAMMESIRSNQPDLVALSVTMPQHLLTCRELVEEIRKEFPEIKIAVGGGAFRSTEHLWRQWPVDFYTEDARELLKRANETMVPQAGGN